MYGESVDNMANQSNPSRGIHITPGSGIVAHLGQFMAYAEGDDDGLNQLVVRLNALAGAPWSEVVRTLTSDIAAAGYDNHPAMACAAIEQDRIGVLVFGELTLSVTTDLERRTLDGRHSSTWIDLAVPGSTARVRCGEQSTSTVVGVLRDGVVAGGGFVFDLHGPIPAATRWDADEAADAPAEPAVAAASAVAAVAVEPTSELAPEDDSSEDLEPVVAEEQADEEVDLADTTEEAAADADPDGESGELVTEEADTPEDIVETETLNGSIFGVPLQDEADEEAHGASENATDSALLADTSLDDVSANGSFTEASANSTNDFPAVSGIFSRNDTNDIEDAEVVVESAPRSADEVFASVGVIDDEAETVEAETDLGTGEEELPPPPVPGPNGLEPAPQGSVAVATVPELRGVLCPSGHLTSIQDSNCRTCGLPVDPTGDIVVGSRPSLGTLTFDDGAQLQLTRPVVIGRGVPERYAIDAEPATTVLLDDVQGTISRVHLEVHLNGWDVEIIDMNSSSGTFTRSGDERARLRSEDPTAILPGTIVEVGQRSFTFSAGPLPAE